MDSPSLPEFCTLLARSRLLTADEVRPLPERWGGARDGKVEDFARWLVAQQYLTDYQAGVLLRGRIGPFLLNECKILDRIGAGRMAGVFKASHRLGQVVAVKVLPPSKAKDAQTFGRFQREARLALRLKHPNVVRTFQTGEADGLHYLVMEYLEGETLEDVLKRRKRLAPAEAVRVVGQALRGLECLHAEGIVHRDLKPGNLMLTPAPADSTLKCRVKILDVGLGRALFDEGPASGELTADGQLLGSPDYMAPEQGRHAHGADVRADIYSLGCVLYHCLASQPPFSGGNAVQKIVQHATTPPRPVRELNPAVPKGLQAVLDDMLAKDPARRHPTPQQAAQALAAFVTAEDAAEPPSPKMQEYLTWLTARQDRAAAPVAAPPADAPQPDFLRSYGIPLAIIAGGLLALSLIVFLIVRFVL